MPYHGRLKYFPPLGPTCCHRTPTRFWRFRDVPLRGVTCKYPHTAIFFHTITAKLFYSGINAEALLYCLYLSITPVKYTYLNHASQFLTTNMFRYDSTYTISKYGMFRYIQYYVLFQNRHHF